MTTSRGITDTRVYDREGVVERYGIPPELVPDFIGLKGDTSDNIPGVPGIGDKTAAQLLQQYGSLESVLEHIDEISGEKRRQNLRENADLARISKELATLQRDIDAGRRRDRDRGPRRPTARGCARCSRGSSCATRCGGWRRRSASRRPPRGPRGERRIEVTLRETTPAGIVGAGRRGRAGGRRADGEALRWAAHDGGELVLAGRAASLAEVLRCVGRPAAGRARLEDVAARRRRRRGGRPGRAPVPTTRWWPRT